MTETIRFGVNGRWVRRVGSRVFLSALGGCDLEGRLTDRDNPAHQAEQAMENARALLESVGSGLAHVCKVTTYITDRAYREPVYEVVGRCLRGIPTVATGLIVKGLADPGMKVLLDLEAEIPLGPRGTSKVSCLQYRRLVQSSDRS